MTSVISDDALKGQQSRIMKAMRAATQPALGDDWRNMSMALSGQAAGGPSYMETTKAQNEQQAKAGLDAELGIYNMMKEQAAQGDTEAAALDSAINEVAGNDPKIYAALLQDLHSDPENVNARNAKSKVMMYAAKRGIVPMSVQKENLGLQKDRLEMSKIRSDMAKAASGGDDPAAVREYDYFKKLSPEEQKNYLSVKRASPQEVFEKEKNKITGKAAGEAVVDLPIIEASSEQSIQLLDDLLKHPGLKPAVGASSIVPVIPGTDAADFVSRLEQLKGKQFLEAYTSLKGSGSITEVEGKKAENAIARMDRAQSEAAFKEAAKEFQGIIRQGINRAKKRAGEEVIPEGGNIGVNTQDGGIKFLGFE